MARRIKSLDELRRPASAPVKLQTVSRQVRILGIDPGSRYTGWGLIACGGQKSEFIAADRIVSIKGTMPERLLAVFNGLSAVIAEHRPDEIALEETFVNRANAQSALVLGQARGVAMLAAARTGLPFAEYAAAQVKLAIAGHGRADKLQMAQMVRLLLKLRADLSEDAVDALAVALCHAHVRGTIQGQDAGLKGGWG
ncbi:MAG: crossover junction endodeoxyribonuclease RuvC [Stagnimonas sp.]|nr:crossover junction endodeoxyribonuclease RuvC [Stagnimonas sp.]